MRITSSSYYSNLYGENNKINRQLFDVNKQISSGLKIQYAHDDPITFAETLRLDDEITTLTQVKNSATSAYKVSTQTDTTIGDMVSTLDSIKTKLLNAANGSQSDTSLQAIAKELRGLQSHLKNLANSSVNGQYLFSGTASSVKPIDDNGQYQGNDKSMEAFLGSSVKQKYNISGAQLFLGEEVTTKRSISTNIPQLSLTDLYPDIMQDSATPRSLGTETYINGDSTIRDMMGDTDTDTTNNAYQTYFYVQGTKTDGTTFKSKIAMNMDATLNDLTDAISNMYGKNQVNVNINANGQIEITDKVSGSSKLDFHMVSAVDFSGGTGADVTDSSLLDGGTNDFENVLSGTNLLYVKEFTRSGTTAQNPATMIEGINYDQTMFTQEGAKLTSNVSQILKNTNAYATASDKLVDAAGVSSLNGEELTLDGTDVNGNAFNAKINFTATGATFTLNGGATNYTIYDAGNPRSAVSPDKMTYQQLMDVVNMAITGNLPASTSNATDYDTAITNAAQDGNVTLDYLGRVTFEDKNNPETVATLSMYDSKSNDFSTTQGSVLQFNSNNALTIRDPKTDFFDTIENAIRAVEEGKVRPDGTDSNDPRNIGIQNAIQMLDDVSDHVSRLQSEAGSYSQVLQASSDRADLLINSSKTLQSDKVDTDVAAATLKLQQLRLNYQALFLSIAKVSDLSLVNYL